MSILKHSVEVCNSQQLDAYINDGRGKIKGIYWETSIDGTQTGDQTETPMLGTYSRQVDQESGNELVLFTSMAEDNVHSFIRVIPESVALNGIVVVFSRKIRT